MIYRMEWTEAVLNSVWEQIGSLCEIPDKNLYETLLKLQKIGYVKKDANIADLSEILICFMRGCVNKYVSGKNSNIKLTKLIAQGFDAIMNNVKAESK